MTNEAIHSASLNVTRRSNLEGHRFTGEREKVCGLSSDTSAQAPLQQCYEITEGCHLLSRDMPVSRFFDKVAERANTKPDFDPVQLDSARPCRASRAEVQVSIEQSVNVAEPPELLRHRVDKVGGDQ